MKHRALQVLVVEPDRPLAALFQQDLTERGHSVHVVRSAEDALEVLAAGYDIVVTGLRLPEMTGERFVQAIRSQPEYADLPVLVIATDRVLPVSISDDATRLRRMPFDIEHLVDYVAEAAGPGRYRN